MLRREFLRKEISSRLSRRLGFALTVELAVGLLLSMGVIFLFFQLTKEVVEGDSRRFDRAVLSWIDEHTPDWLDGSILYVTTLGDFEVILPLLVVATYFFYRKGARISAMLLPISTLGGIVLTETLKRVFERTRPEFIDSVYSAPGYSFPSGHAAFAVGFYGTLTLLLAWRLTGFRRWSVAVAGVTLILLIGFSRLYLGVHYPTDILAGFLAAPLWVGTVGLAFFLYRLVRGGRNKET